MSLEDTIRQIVRDEMRLMKNPHRTPVFVVGDRVIVKRTRSYDPDYDDVEVGRVGTVERVSEFGLVDVDFGDLYRTLYSYDLGYDY